MGGLTGGHSGNEIDKGRANANMLMGRVLQDLAGRTDLRLADVHGGLKSNAIPVESTATIVVDDAAAARTGVAEMEETLRNEYHITDPALFLKVEDAAVADTPMDAATTSKAICPADLPAQRHPGHEPLHRGAGADFPESGHPSSPPKPDTRAACGFQSAQFGGFPERDAQAPAGRAAGPAGRSCGVRG